MRTALITGSAHGIGRATAQELIRQGWRVQGIDREMAHIESAEYFHHILDLTSDGVFELILGFFKEIEPELIIHSAGVGIMQQFAASTLEADKKLIDLNVWAAYAVVKAFVQCVMDRKEPQHLILITSLAGLSATPGMALYSGSKHFVGGLAKSVSGELAVDAPWAKVSTIAPPPVKTKFREHSGRLGRSRPIRGILEVDTVVKEILAVYQRPKLDRIPGRLQRWAFLFLRPLIPAAYLSRRIYSVSKQD